MADIVPPDLDLGIAKLTEQSHPRCSKCRYGENEGGVIVCHRHPPQVQVVMAQPASVQVGRLVPQVIQAWPTVPPNSWCGDFDERAR